MSINIDDLTIGQLKQIQAMTASTTQSQSSLQSRAIGKYVIVRSRNEGVNAGILVEADETGCVLKNAKRLYRPISKDRKLSWYEGVAVSGLGDKSMVSGAVEEKVIIEDYSLTLCTEEAQESIEGFKANETTC